MATNNQYRCVYCGHTRPGFWIRTKVQSRVVSSMVWACLACICQLEHEEAK